jgi:VWFA-related protein
MKPPYIGRHLSFALCALLALLCAPPDFPQPSANPQSQTQSQNPPPPSAVRVTSRLIQVNVVVRKKGQPVTGLTKDDFSLTDQGQPQSIAYFSEQTYSPSAPPAPAPATAHPVVFSNRYDQQSAVPNSVTIILLDALNTPPQDMAMARPEIVKFLRQLQPQDRVALYGLSTNLVILHDFTSDTSSLLRALDQARLPNSYQPGAADVEPSGTGDDNLDAFIDAANQKIADMQTINRAEMTTNVMAWIANSVANIPGRKNLVWVSAGFPFQVSTALLPNVPPNVKNVPNLGGSSPTNSSNAPGPDDAQPYRRFLKEIESASEAVNNSNLAIYPVDARGIIPTLNMSVTSDTVAMPPTNNGKPSTRRPGSPVALPPRGNYDTMIELADRTGGEAFYNTNDINGSIRRAIDDSRQSYVLSYYPTDAQSDGKFHEIRLKVKESGLDVRYRRGYLAIPQASTDPLLLQQTVQNAVISPFEDSQLGLTVEAHPTTAAGAAQLSAHLQMEGAQMRFQQGADGWADDLQVVWVQLGVGGKVLLVQGQTVGIGLSQQSYEQSQKPGVKVSRDLDLPLKTETVKVRLIVVDGGSGAVGSVDIPLKSLTH